MPPPPPHDHLIAGRAAVGLVSPAAEAALRGLPMRIQSVAADQDIVREGSKPRESVLVLEGFLCRHKVVAETQRQILSFHIPGDMPDLQSLHIEVMDYALAALTPSTVAFIPHAAIRSAIKTAPDINDLLWHEALADAAIFRAWIASLGRRDAVQRVAHLFCEVFARMSARGLADPAGFVLPISQAEMADALGLSPVHVNRTLQELRREGVIVSAGQYHSFTNWRRLAEIGDFDPSYLQLKHFKPPVEG